MEGTNPTMSERICTYIHQHGRTHLLWYVERNNTYNHHHGRKHLVPYVKRHSTYIWPWKEANSLTMSEWHLVLDWGFLVTDQVPPLSRRMETTFISDQVGTHPSITSEWPCTHIWSCENTSHSHIRTALNPRLSFPGTSLGNSIPRMETSLNHIRMAMCSHLIM